MHTCRMLVHCRCHILFLDSGGLHHVFVGPLVNLHDCVLASFVCVPVMFCVFIFQGRVCAICANARMDHVFVGSLDLLACVGPCCCACAFLSMCAALGIQGSIKFFFGEQLGCTNGGAPAPKGDILAAQRLPWLPTHKFSRFRVNTPRPILLLLLSSFCWSFCEVCNVLLNVAPVL